jgi:histone deacetylase complex regulatory component SIN3
MMKEGTHLNYASPLSPPRPADDSIVTASAGITSASAAGVTFPDYPPSSLVTRSSNTNSSSSQQKTKPSSRKYQEQAGQDYAATHKRRRITLSTIQALRSCTTYVTRVKTSLLASNHDAEFDAFLELLCNWSDQGLTPKEVFSQMEAILQDVSPELLAAFTTFLPGDTQEKARLHHIASASSSSRMPIIAAAHEDEIQVVSAISDTKHLDSDNEDKV